MENDLKEIGKRLRALRESQGISQHYFGSMFNTTGRMVGHWERGEYLPENIEEIADFFSVSIEYIIYGAVKKAPEKRSDVLELKPGKLIFEPANEPSRDSYLCDIIINGLLNLSPERRNQALGCLQALWYMDIA